jgi:hypothetical protein
LGLLVIQHRNRRFDEVFLLFAGDFELGLKPEGYVF